MIEGGRYWLVNEKERAEVVLANVDIKRVRELLEAIPFSVTDWKEHFKPLGIDELVTKEDDEVLTILYPYLRALVIINYLQETLRDEDIPNYDLTRMAPLDVIFNAYNLRLVKVLFQDILELNEVYDIVVPMLTESGSGERALWDHYDKVVSSNENYLALVTIVRNFYNEHGDKIYKQKVKIR